MAKPSAILISKLGPEITPFERMNRNNPSNPKRLVAIGEAISYKIKLIDCTQGLIDDVTITTRDKLDFFSKYLWVITKDGLFIILENTENLESSRKVVCHTNITGGESALQGGELWFLSKIHVVINYSSGRYGAETIEQEDAVKEYFESLGFKVDIS